MSYTKARAFSPIVEGPLTGWWRCGQAFEFYINDDKTGDVIRVVESDFANGADVPPPWCVALVLTTLLAWPLGFTSALITGLFVAGLTGWLLPPIHAEYLASTFIHDIGLTKHRHLSRRRIDKMFFKAMRLTARRAEPHHGVIGHIAYGWRRVRPYIMFGGVVLFGLIKERHRYFRPLTPKK